MAIKIFAFDIDVDICKTKGNDYNNSIPNKKVIYKINHLHDQGNQIIIFTARFMGRTNNDYKKAYDLGYSFTLEQLKSWNVKFDKLFFGKPSFDMLIDDKAFNYSESWLTKI